MKKTVLLVFLLLLFPSIFWGQGSIIPTYSFSYNNGLPTKVVHNLTKDHDGFIWLASQNGVFRFDGKTFYPYTTREGLCDNEIIDILVDKHNVVWCTGYNGRISSIRNGVVDTTNHWIKNWEAGQFFMDIVEDSHGNLYMAGAEGVMYGLDTARRLSIPHKIGATVLFMGIYNDTLLMSVDTATWGYDIHNQYKKINYRHRFHRNDSLFVSRANNGMWKREKAGLKNVYTGQMIDLSDYTNERIQYFVEVDRRYVIVSFRVEKAILYDLYTHTYQTIELPPNSRVVDACKDNEGHVWVSGYAGGLFCLKLPAEEEPGIAPILGDNIIHCLKDGNRMYAVSHGGQVFIKEGQKTKTIGVSQKNVKHAIKLDNAVFTKIQNNVFLAWEAGLVMVEDSGLVYLMGGAKDICLYRDSLCFGNAGHVLWCKEINRQKGAFLGQTNILFRHRTFAIALQGDRVWMSTMDGLRYYDILTRQMHEPVYKTPDGGKIESIKLWQNKLLLLGTNNHGLILFDGERVIGDVTVENGLFSNECHEIDLCSQGWLVRHPYGLSLVDVYNNRVQSISQWENIPMLAVNRVDVYGDTVYLSTRLGLFQVTLASLFEQKADARSVKFIQVASANKQFNPDDVWLDYGNNQLKIVFSLAEYNNPTQVQYRWRLNGGVWNDLSTNTLEFVNMQGGDYTLELKAKVSNHAWTGVSPLHFRVGIPFWQRWWFWASAMLLLAIVGWILLRWMYRRRLFAEREKASVRYQLMDFEQKALNAMMNPHFVFNAMGSIQHLLTQGDTRQANDYLVKFSRLIRKSLETSQLEFCYLDDEIERLTLYLQLEKMRFGGRMDFSIDVSDDLDAEQVKIPTMILQTYVENAVIHGVATVKRKADVRIRFATITGGIRAEIEDNGPGFDVGDKKKRSVRFGVSATEKRLELLTQIRGKPYSVNIVSPLQPEGGTRVELLFSLS